MGMRQRQLALKAIHAYSKSLSDSHGLHPPIIMREDAKKDEKEKEKEADSKKKKEEEPAKVSKKQQEILDKRAKEEEEKVKEYDRNQTKQWEPKVDALEPITDLGKFESELLDLLLGYNRITDSFVGFPMLSKSFKTDEAQAKIMLKLVKSIRNWLKKAQLDKLPADTKDQARRLVVYFYCIIQETMKSFCKRDLIDGKGIKLIQETLRSIGFPKTANSAFASWKQTQEKFAAKNAEAAAGAS